jgi:hypothetical protein
VTPIALARDRPASVLALAVLTAASYASWIGWDQNKTLGSDGYQHGPYDTWQVVGLVVSLAVLALAAGWHQHAVLGAVVISATTTLLFSVDAATDVGSDGLWGVGAVLVAVGAMAGSIAVGKLGTLATRRRSIRPTV